MSPDDADARISMWKAIRVAANVLLESWDVRVFLRPDTNEEIVNITDVPQIPTWKLFEIISVLAVLTKAQSVTTKNVLNLMGKTGPIEYMKDQRQLYLWTQSRMVGQASGLGGIPDIVITNTSDTPSATNAIHIIESKCSQSLSTSVIRAEFAKAVDLRVRSYFVWSFFSPSQRLIQGARSLRIELTASGFDTNERKNLLDPHNFLFFVSEQIEESITAGRFANFLEGIADEVSKKAGGLVISPSDKD
jgi:hypothetical protein